MGGIHLVEPVEHPEATTGVGRPVVRFQVIEGTNAEAEGLVQATSGLMVEPEEGRVTIITLEMLEWLVNDPDIDIQLTEDEIMDRSKGDGLSRIILILQSSWFIVQCIARRVQGLDISQLKLTTLALASLNGVTFMMWWDKPLGVKTPVRVYLKRKLTDVERKVVGVSSFFRR